MRVKCKLAPFIHETKLEIEKYAYQSKWTENTLIDAVKKSDTSHTLETANKIEKSTQFD